MQDRDALLRLLDRCTVRLVIDSGREVGTGFFVAPGLLLTCAHVLNGAADGSGTIEVEWDGQKSSAALEQITDKTYPDLALLKTSAITNHPCVYLSPEVSLDDQLYTYGYPKAYIHGDPLTFKYISPTGAPQTLLTFSLGNLRPGFSGGPLLNLRTGAVCGITKRTAGENTLLGGRGVPIIQALQAFPQLKTLQEQYHRQHSQWAEHLTSQQLQISGLDKFSISPVPKAIEIFFSYHDNGQDQEMLKALEKQLVVLRRKGVINAWHKGRLMINDEVEVEIRRHLDAAQIICLMISPDYIADDELYERHVTRAMERRENEGVIVIPILVRQTSNWTGDDTPFGRLMPLPRNKIPMNQWKDLDEVSAEVAGEIRRTVEDLRST